MLTSKQRSYLKGLANNIDTIINIGKSSLTPELTQNIYDALEKRELIKIGVLNNCEDEPKNLATLISERTSSQIVQIIGKKIVLYKPAKKPVIVLPK